MLPKTFQKYTKNTYFYNCMPDLKKIQSIHDNLTKSGYELPDVNTMANDLQDDAKVQRLYETLTKEGYEVPDLETFRTDLGLKKKETTSQASSSAVQESNSEVQSTSSNKLPVGSSQNTFTTTDQGVDGSTPPEPDIPVVDNVFNKIARQTKLTRDFLDNPVTSTLTRSQKQTQLNQKLVDGGFLTPEQVAQSEQAQAQKEQAIDEAAKQDNGISIGKFENKGRKDVFYDGQDYNVKTYHLNDTDYAILTDGTKVKYDGKDWVPVNNAEVSQLDNIYSTSQKEFKDAPQNITTNLFPNDAEKDYRYDVNKYLYFLKENSPNEYENIANKVLFGRGETILTPEKNRGSVDLGNKGIQQIKQGLIYAAWNYKLSDSLDDEYKLIKQIGSPEKINKYRTATNQLNNVNSTPEQKSAAQQYLAQNYTPADVENITQVLDIEAQRKDAESKINYANNNLVKEAYYQEISDKIRTEQAKKHPVIYSLADAGATGWNTIVSAANNILQLPKRFDIDNKYGVADLFSDSITQLTSEATIPTVQRKLYDEKTGEVNPSAILPMVAGAVTNMYLLGRGANLVGSPGLGYNLGTLVSSFAVTNNDYYEKAKGKMTDNQANAFAIAASALTSSLELISPGEKIWGEGGIAKIGLDEALERFAKGESFNKIVGLGKEVLNENIQELSQDGGDLLMNGIANSLLGKNALDTNYNWNDFLTTVTATTLATGLAGGLKGVQHTGESRDEILNRLAANNGILDIALNTIQSNVDSGLISQDKATKLTEELTTKNAQFNAMPTEWNDNKKAAIATAQDELLPFQKAQYQTGPDGNLQEVPLSNAEQTQVKIIQSKIDQLSQLGNDYFDSIKLSEQQKAEELSKGHAAPVTAILSEVKTPDEAKAAAEQIIEIKDEADKIGTTTFADVIDRPVTYKGDNGIIYQDGQTLVFKVDNSNKEFEIGNVDELRDKNIQDLNFDNEKRNVSFNDNGELIIDDKSYGNDFTNPLNSINYAPNGDILSVELTSDGKKRTFRGQIAEDIAYQLHLKEINKNNKSQEDFLNHINTDEEATTEINNGGFSETTKENATPNNEKVQREKVERKVIVPENKVDFTGKQNDVLSKDPNFFTPEERTKYHELMQKPETEGEAAKMVSDKKEELKKESINPDLYSNNLKPVTNGNKEEGSSSKGQEKADVLTPKPIEEKVGSTENDVLPALLKEDENLSDIANELKSSNKKVTPENILAIIESEIKEVEKKKVSSKYTQEHKDSELEILNEAKQKVENTISPSKSKENATTKSTKQQQKSNKQASVKEHTGVSTSRNEETPNESDNSNSGENGTGQAKVAPKPITTVDEFKTQIKEAIPSLTNDEVESLSVQAEALKDFTVREFGLTEEEAWRATQGQIVKSLNELGTDLVIQEHKGTFKGATNIKEGKTLYGPKADTSTVTHETHHNFLGLIDSLAANGNKKAEAMQRTINQWVDSKEGEKFGQREKLLNNYSVHRQEFFARSAEKYFSEGKRAGFSERMNKVFDSFKKFLGDIYKGIKNSPKKIVLSPEIRNLFDTIYGKEVVEKEIGDKIKSTTTNEGIRDYMKRNDDTHLLGNSQEPRATFLRDLINGKVVLTKKSLKDLYRDVKEGVPSNEYTKRLTLSDEYLGNKRKGKPKGVSIDKLAENLTDALNSEARGQNTEGDRFEYRDIRNMIEDVIHTHTTRLGAFMEYKDIMDKLSGANDNNSFQDEHYVNQLILEHSQDQENYHEAIERQMQEDVPLSDSQLLELANKYLNPETAQVDIEAAYKELPNNIVEQLIQYTNANNQEAVNGRSENSRNENTFDSTPTETKQGKGSLEKGLDSKISDLTDKAISLQQKYTNQKQVLSENAAKVSKVDLFNTQNKEKLFDDKVGLNSAEKIAREKLQSIQDEIDKTNDEIDRLEKSRPSLIEADKKQGILFQDGEKKYTLKELRELRRNDIDEETPPVPPAEEKPKTEEADNEDGYSISKQGIFDRYGKKFEKAKLGWTEISQQSLDRLCQDAEEKNSTVEQQAKVQVDNMVEEIKHNRLSVSHFRITAAVTHLINTEEAIDNLSNQKASTPQERADLKAQLDLAIEERDKTLEVIDKLGSASGRNLGLFAGIFSKNNDGGLKIAVRKIEGVLGVELPETVEALDKISETQMSATTKNKIRPFVAKIEQIKKEYEAKIKELEANAKKPSAEKIKKERKKVSDNLRDLESKLRNAKSINDILGKNKNGNPDIFFQETPYALNTHELLADAVKHIADGVEEGKEIADLIDEAAEQFKGENSKEDFQNLLDLALGKLPAIDKSIVGKDVPFDVKEDAVDEQRELIRKTTLGKLNQLQNSAEHAVRSKFDKFTDWRRAFLTGGLKTIGRVLISGVSKVIVDPLVKQTTGRITSSIFPGLGHEKVTLKNAAEGFNSLRKFSSDAAANEYVKKLENEFDAQSEKLGESNQELDRLKTQYGENSAEYNDYLNGEHREIGNAYSKAELNYAESTIYKWIHGNVGIDAKDILLHSSTDFDQAMGGYGKLNPKELKGADKALYVVDFMNRIHGVLKSPSARRALVEAYNTKLLEYQNKGVPLTASTRLRALDMAYVQYQAGKYQEYNQLTELINKGKYLGESKNANALQKFLSGFIKIAIPIARVPINIVKSGVDLTAGGVEGLIRYGYEINKAKKGLSPEHQEQYNTVWRQLGEAARNIPEKDAAYINKLLSRQLFGGALMATAAYMLSQGLLAYGGEYDEDKPRKRSYIGKDGKRHELDYGQWVINGHPMGKFGSGVLNHLPEFLPIALVANTKEVYDYEHDYKGKSGRKKLRDETDSFKGAFLSDLNEIYERTPVPSLLNPGDIPANLVSIPIFSNIAEYFDKDANGNAIERKPENLLQRYEMNVGLRSQVPKKKK